MIDSDTRAVESDSHDPIGGRYKIQRVLGRGGMATVYLCEDAQDSALVAVKVLRQEIGSAVVVERFIREIEFASRLEHVRIPRVLDSGTTSNGTPFYVMTYIEGESLRELLDRVKQLPIDQALQIAAAVMEPMTYAHRMGIVHRDIKPGNIVIGSDGVHVLDFGIARAIVASADDRLTSTGIAIGTPAYMSPEQALGDHDLDARSDIYSLGCVIYEMIAGIPPFVGATPQAAMARRFAAIAPPLSETRDGVPLNIVSAVARALSRSPADRWQTVRQFGDALTARPAEATFQKVADQQSKRRSRSARVMLALLTTVIAGAATYATAEVRKDHLGKAMRDIASWDFDGAERRMRLVVDKDPQRAPERVLLAQLLMLKGEPPAAWKPLVVQALAAPHKLDSAAALRSRALIAFSEQDYVAACGAFGKLADVVRGTNSNDVTAALAHADCLREDRAIVPDATSPTGYRFRASLAFVDSVYGATLDRFSAEPRAFSVVAPRMQQVLTLDPRQLRTGRMTTGTRSRWYSLPILDGDTLSYIPHPLPPSGGVAEFGKAEALAAAIERNRRRLRAVATEWTARAPEDPRSHEMLATILEAGGELDGTVPSALAEIRSARGRLNRNVGSSGDLFMRHLHLGDDQVRILLRIGQYGAAARLADSILAIRPPSVLNEATRRQSVDVRWRLSALRGKVEDVIDLEVPYAADVRALTNEGLEELPPLIAIDVIALNNYSVFGGPRDSITIIARRISDRIGGLVSPTKRTAIRNAVLRRPFVIAAPIIGTSPIASLPASDDPLMLAMVAHSRRDFASLRRNLDLLDSIQRELPPGEISMDVTYLKAWLAASIGEEARASEIVDNAFAGISKASRSALGSPELIGTFVRAMLLRSQLAARAQDASAARLWRNAATDLWGRSAVSTYMSNTPLAG